MLKKFERLPRDEFEISDPEYQRLFRTIEHWRGILVDLSPDHLQNKRGLERGDDMGLGL